MRAALRRFGSVLDDDRARRKHSAARRARERTVQRARAGERTCTGGAGMSHSARTQADFQEFLLRGTRRSRRTSAARSACRIDYAPRHLPPRVSRASRARRCCANYPAAVKLLGAKQFAQMAAAYIVPTIRAPFRSVTTAMPRALLVTEPSYRPVPFLADLARWEWTIADVFDAADAVPVRRRSPRGHGAGAMGDLSFGFHPSVGVSRSHRMRRRCGKPDGRTPSAPRPHAATASCTWLLWRHDVRSFPIA